MKETVTKTVTKCDVCGEEVHEDNLAKANEGFHYALVEMKFTIYYGGTYIIKDVCDSCNKEIMTLLFNKGYLSHSTRM